MNKIYSKELIWMIQRWVNWAKKKNRKSKKVTDLKTKELDENTTERKCTQIVNVNFGSKSTFHLNLIASSFPLSKSY